jgi:DNA-binding response OmpR family regulator
MANLALILDPDQLERRHVAALLAADGWDEIQVGTAIKFFAEVLDKDPDLMVVAEELDPLQLQDVVAIVRQVTPAPILVIGSGGADEEVAALEEGGDYYLRRSFDALQLIGRARQLARRIRPPGNSQSKRTNLPRRGQSPTLAAIHPGAQSAPVPMARGNLTGGEAVA